MNAFKNTCLVLLVLALGFLMYLYSEQDKELTMANETIAARDKQIAENDQTIMNQNAQLMRLTSNTAAPAGANAITPAASTAASASTSANATATASIIAAANARAAETAAALAAAQAQSVKEATAYDAAVQKLIKLPANEGLPNYASIKDAAGLKKLYPFFKDAQNGDIVLIYKDQMVIYRKSANKVIDFKLISQATLPASASR